ncbi:MAG: glycosyltransferase [Vulcanococcus sp.]|uniref:glycosyltransferase n=1 Tax=Vulcanococcus sp. TaxID=2856995 RepID=UPI0025D2C722|nr:glycosyltransferase [Vulcanococcus sp.]MBW0166544.1 glycosyltransferase [Vulcanococcus sp.]
MTDASMPSKTSRDVVLLATADWDHPFWTNKQHVARSMAQLGHRVLYVESVGLRPPRLEAQDLRRVFRRLRLGLRPPRRVEPMLWVWSPLLIPAPRTALQRNLNRLVFAGLLALWRRLLGLRADLLWTYNPLTALLLPLQPSGYRQLAYHCVDDLAAQPCMPVPLIQREEERLCRICDQVFVTSLELLHTRSPFNPHIRYDPNVADVAHFARARDRSGPVPMDLQNLPVGPRLGFVGAVSGYKLDLELLARLARHRPDVQLVLIGRVGEGDPGTDLQLFQGLINVHLLGPRPYEQLPDYLRGFDLALLPSPINAYTRSMFPMKFFEYVAAGVPVVATDLPALQDQAHLAQLCSDTESFLTAVDRLLADPPGLGARTPVPLQNLPDWCSYSRRTQSMLDELHRRLHPASSY